MTARQMAFDTQAHNRVNFSQYISRETKLTLRIALNPKSKLTLECGTNPTNRNTIAYCITLLSRFSGVRFWAVITLHTQR